jgi:beta-glucosidase-like glycosyl hydrolase
MTLEQKIGQFFFPAVFINDSEENIQATEALIQKYNIGGLTFFHSRASAATNYEGSKKITLNDNSYDNLKELIERYQKCAPTPLLISIDAEWGLAMRVENTPQYPYAITLGALPNNSKDLVYQVGKQIGKDLKSVGINYNLAPLADINNNPNNPVIGYRSFGENKEKVADFAIEYLRGLNDAGVLGCLKHFPGHGNTNVDSHLGLPILEENLEQLLANELHPFIHGITHKVDSIMIGHLAVPALHNGAHTSATLSKVVIEDLLRKRLNYDGLVISDALNMHSVSKLFETRGQLEWEAFNAGNDVLCFAENIPQGIAAIVKNATEARIESSYKRIQNAKEKAGLFHTKQKDNTTLDFEAATALNLEIAENCLTKIKGESMNQIVLDASKKKSLATLSIYKNKNNTFIETLDKNLNLSNYSIENTSNFNSEEINKELAIYDTVIIALFVPKAKPNNNFDIDHQIITYLEELLPTKKCVLYLFGNPYALQVIKKIESSMGIIQVYQDFDTFQHTAATLMTKEGKYLGSLPVTINFST